jgi:hypothetical protein
MFMREIGIWFPGKACPVSGSMSGEVAAPLRRRQNSLPRSRRGLYLPCLLHGKEEEGVIAPDGPANRAPELMAFEPVASRCKKVPGIQRFIAVKLEQGSMKAIGAGLGNAIDHCACGPPIFRAEIVSLDSKFL